MSVASEPAPEPVAPTPRPRPTTFDELGFDRQKPIVWFSPGELVQTAKKLAISKVFGDYADKRELIGTLPDPGVHDYSERSELWVDYVADLGDGFDGTYSVALLLAARKLEPTDPSTSARVATSRGDVLVMGGDEVYPAASIENYEERTIGPYRAAFPFQEEDRPGLFVIPGNHDWYDGLTAWMRMFAQRKNIGGWQTHQARSYFALKLPHGWWLWGIDVQFDSYIDAPQMDYFRRIAAEDVQPGDQIVLCSATPEWVNCHRSDPESFRTLDYFERQVIVPSDATLRIAISGDAHHYAHYASDAGDLHRITSGGGGAYLAATHELPDRLVLPPEASTDRRKTNPAVTYRRTGEFPDVATSRRLGRSVWRLPWTNRSFAGLVGFAYAFYAWAAVAVAARVAAGPTRSPIDLWHAYVAAARDLDVVGAALGLIGQPSSLLVSAVVASSLFGLTKRRGPRRLLVGAAHLAVQSTILVAVVAGVFALAASLPAWGALVAGIAGSAVAGSIAGPLVLAGYLRFGDQLGRNVNEQFSAMRIEDFKNFLRLHIDHDGALTIYPIGVRDVARRWRLVSEGAPDEPWLVPDGEPLDPVLIEAPIRLERDAASGSATS